MNMTVDDLIQLLKTFPQDAPVCFRLYSEFCMLKPKDINTQVLGTARADGWVPDARTNNSHVTYVVFPGN